MKIPTIGSTRFSWTTVVEGYTKNEHLAIQGKYRRTIQKICCLVPNDKFLSLQTAIRYSLVTAVIFHEWKWNCRGAFHGESATFVRFSCFHRVRASRATGSDNSAKPLQLAVQSTQLANPLAFNPPVWFDARFRTTRETLETRLKLIRSLLNIASNCEWRGQEIDGSSRGGQRGRYAISKSAEFC